MKLKITSDGNPVNTRLVDENSNIPIGGIQKITWNANASNFVTSTNVELVSVSLDFVCKASVDLLEWDNLKNEMVYTKTFEKNVKIVSKHKEKSIVCPITDVLITDVDTGETIAGIQDIFIEITPTEMKAKIKKIKFTNSDW